MPHCLLQKHLNGWKRDARCGVGLIEAVIGTAILTLVLSLSVASVNNFFLIGKKTTDRVRAAYLAQEGVEAVRFVRDAGWASIVGVPVDTVRYLTIATSSISITTTPETIGDFERTVVVRDVYRATVGDYIVASTSPVSNTLDPNTKLVEVDVSAPATGVRVLLGAYLTNLWQE